MMRLVSLIVTIPVTLFVVLFAVSNRAPITFSLFPFDLEIAAPGFLMPLILFVLGFLVGGLLQAPGLMKAKLAARKARKETAAEHDRLVGMRRRVAELERQLAARQAQPEGLSTDEAPRQLTAA